MLPELHPYLEREYSLWWPYAYFCLLLLLVGGGFFFLYKLIKKQRVNRQLRKSVRRIAHFIHRENDADFLKSVALELFSVTRSSSGCTFPCEEWLESISTPHLDFTVPPHRLLLDACLQPPESVARLTSEERELIGKNVIQLIRGKYV